MRKEVKEKSWKANVMTLTLNEMRTKLEMNEKKMAKEWEEKVKLEGKEKWNEIGKKENEMERVRNMSKSS